MPLRWTVTEKWRDKWFRTLKPRYKLLWLYLCDSCDIAGIIEWDLPLWSREVGGRISDADFWEVFAGRAVEIPGTDKIWIPKVIEIQQRCLIDELNAENNAHKPILQAVEKYNLKDLLRGLGGACQPPCRGTSNSKGKDKKIEKKKFAEFVTMTEEEYGKLLTKLGGERRVKAAIEILDNYKGAKGRQYASDYRAILNWVVDELVKRESKFPQRSQVKRKNRCEIHKREYDGQFCPQCFVPVKP